jgi:radical SAM protein with 4Fe4S-binding SPASM domain
MEYLATVSMELASKCNLKCRMCSHPTNQRETEVMSMDRFKVVIDKILKTNIRQLFLNMGEPLMNKGIFRMISYAKRKGFFVCISTNGLLLTEDSIGNMIKTGVDVLKFSIEGTTPEIYHSIRVGGNFDRLFRNVVRMKEIRDRSGSQLRIRISTILMKGNENIVEFVKYWGPYCDEVEYTAITNHIGLVDNREVALSPHWHHRKGCPQVKPYKEVNVLCNGDMVICCVDFHGRCVLGNLVEQEFEDTWNSEKMTEIRARAYSDNTQDLDPCRECHIVDYSSVLWKNMRDEVSLVHDAVKNRMWDVLQQVQYVDGPGTACAACRQTVKISFAGFCLQCLERKTKGTGR